MVRLIALLGTSFLLSKWAFAFQLDQTKPHVEDELIVSFDNNISQVEQNRVIEAIGGDIVHRFKFSPSVLVRVSDSFGFMETAEALRSDSSVAQVGLNRIFSIQTETDDPKIDKQYHHELIDTFGAWSTSTGSHEVTVAVIDTGIDYTHPDIAGNSWTNPGESGFDEDGNDKRSNGIDDDGNGYVDDFRGWDFVNNDNDPMDDHSHGTHCAGSIGALGNNGKGISGVNWSVGLVGLKFLSRSGRGTLAGAIEAIEYSVMMGFDITNNSWGGEADSLTGTENDPLKAAIKATTEAGQLFIAAAGNNGRNTDEKKIYPASYDLDNIISVAAGDKNDNLANFSNFGPETVDLMAPGAAIFSTSIKSFWGEPYKTLSGTSMAAPMVAGAAALVKAHVGDITALDIKDSILESVDEIDGIVSKVGSSGRLNVARALEMSQYR